MTTTTTTTSASVLYECQCLVDMPTWVAADRVLILEKEEESGSFSLSGCFSVIFSCSAITLHYITTVC